MFLLGKKILYRIQDYIKNLPMIKEEKKLKSYLGGDLVERHFPHETIFNNERNRILLVLIFNLDTLRRVLLDTFQHIKLLDLGSSLLQNQSIIKQKCLKINLKELSFGYSSYRFSCSSLFAINTALCFDQLFPSACLIT